ncbi:MAG: hypothetical protein QXJ73_04730 [Candidatus Caldarchaeum sp.]
MQKERILRKVVRVGGGTKIIALPNDFDASYVWVIREPDGVRVVPAEVK